MPLSAKIKHEALLIRPWHIPDVTESWEFPRLAYLLGFKGLGFNGRYMGMYRDGSGAFHESDTRYSVIQGHTQI